MTFATYETSAEAADPVELFSFFVGDDDYLYTSAEDDYTLGDVFEAAPIQRDEIRVPVGPEVEPLSCWIAASSPFVARFLGTPPGQRTSATVQRVHRSDPDQEAKLIYAGYVQAMRFSDDFTRAHFSIVPPRANPQAIPRFTFGGQCNDVLGGDYCQVDIASPSFRLTAAVSGVSSTVITVPGANGFADGFFAGGFMTALAADEHRLILEHTGNDLTVLRPFSAAINGTTVEVTAGCDHLIEGHCATRFDNVANFVGFPFVPVKNPYATGVD